MVLVIDNYDSFTFNLVQYLGEMNVDLQVQRNDQITLDQIRALKPERILISQDRAPHGKRGSPMRSSGRLPVRYHYSEFASVTSASAIPSGAKWW